MTKEIQLPGGKTLVARKVTIDELYEGSDLCIWSNGSIRGTKLPMKDREIRVSGLEGQDLRAALGDWIVMGSGLLTAFNVYNEREFKFWFMEPS